MLATIPEAVVVVTEAFEGTAVPRWGDLIDDAMALSPRRLIVDLHGCPVMDAAAIEVLRQAHRSMIAVGGQLILRRPRGRVRRILRLAGLDHVFHLEDAAPAWTAVDGADHRRAAESRPIPSARAG
ncbi:STAS domain-containing protein [Krasilnikovia sp. M28-CT-15]|uniref:STAS domain-containing protein n=1 Tax=Krasilnikovia sp. M28-CT-15 TaxID=3373540 RepID=UPI003876ACA7